MWFLGIDVGTTHLKVVGVTAEGSVLEPARVRTPVRTEGAESYHDGEAIWAAVRDLATEYAAGPVADAEAGALGGVAIATFGQEESFPVDERGDPLSGSRVWWESWADRELDAGTIAWLDSVEHYRVSGMRFRDNQSPERIAQFRARHPESWSRTAHWVDFGSYLGFRLTGRWVASSTQVTHSQVFDLESLAPHAPSLAKLDLDASLFVPVGRPGERVGAILPSALPGVTLAPDAALHVGGHDQVMAAFATAEGEGSAIIDSIGTAEYVMVTGRAVTPDAGLHAMCADVEHGWSGDGYVLGWGLPTGKILQLLAETYLQGDFERLLAAIDPSAAESPAAGPSDGIMFEVNDLRDLDDALFSVAGVPEGARPEHIVRACVDQLSSRIRATVGVLAEHAGVSPGPVHLTGSLFQRPEMVRHREHTWGSEMRVSTLGEAVATGAAQSARAAYRRMEPSRA
ncbi:FGGY family carbohydrate kinase [Herbiconiux solani]|uniref:FGGY family carbohydrate kinase n=1 Tax=Herbiconiux solani TaxID=661329 RepID=UPI0008252F06|nr:FGGY family carbohydrate kinase [Herbiconiux solani]